MKIQHSVEKTKHHGSVDTFLITNSQGISITLLNYGALLSSVKTPDAQGAIEEITLGFETCEEYFTEHPFFGVSVGRFANRIAGGRFVLDGKTYTLAQNNGKNHLHGGLQGFDKVFWKAAAFEKPDVCGVRFSYTSRDGEEGYPGNLDVDITYSLNEKNELTIEYRAQTDKPTPVNLTNHAYWNLHGSGKGTILEHELLLMCDRYVPVNAELIPTGELKRVEGTPMDFTKRKPVGKDIGSVEGGYDHCFVIMRKSERLAFAAELKDPVSRRVMKVFTSQPGIQLYTGNFLEGQKGSGNKTFVKHQALCLETQGFPDAVNQPHFPSAILRPGDIYDHTTVHTFSVA